MQYQLSKLHVAESVNVYNLDIVYFMDTLP